MSAGVAIIVPRRQAKDAISIFSNRPAAPAQMERDAMSSRKSVSLATAAAFAITTVMFPVYGSAARDRASVTTEFSADNADQKKNQEIKKEEHKENKIQSQERRKDNKIQTQDRRQENKIQSQERRHENKQQTQERRQENKIQSQERRQQNKNVKVFTRSGNNAVVVGGKLRGGNGAAQFSMGGRNYSSWRGGGGWRHQGHDGRWETFVALSALGVLAIGAYEYYPYAYIDAPRPYCEGITEDGCQLDFQDVQTQEGYVVGQCVAYCPWQQ
jgi:hypothetical protein